jgi:dephospho-CoA kinase
MSSAKIKIIGIGGTDGSGKDSIGELLAEKHGWLFVSGSDILREELKKQGKELKRENLREFADSWRREFGPGILVDKSIENYRNNKKKYSGLVIASLRNPGEVERVHEFGGKVVWVDADPKVRYQRITNRNRGSEDQVSFEEFLAEQKIQSDNKGDISAMSLKDVKAMANIFIENNGNDMEKFKDQAEKALRSILS